MTNEITKKLELDFIRESDLNKLMGIVNVAKLNVVSLTYNSYEHLYYAFYLAQREIE